MGRIVVGIDGSPSSAEALRWAHQEAALRGVPLHVIHAWTYPWVGPRPDVMAPVDEARMEASRILDEAVAALVAEAGDQVPVTSELVEGNPVEAMLAAAGDADLLVVGSRGRGGFASLLLGSVSQQVVHYAPCPVAIVRAEAGRSG